MLKDIIHANITPGFTYKYPTGNDEDKDTRHGPGFIDDQIDVADLDTHDAATSLPQSQNTLQAWQNLLHVSGGGDLSLPKCSYGTLQFTFAYHKNGDTATIKENTENPGQISLQPLHQLLPRVPLKRLTITAGDRYLGIRITIDRNWKDEFIYRLQKHKTLSDIIINSNISRTQAYMIHSVHFKPAIKYALEHTRFTPKQLKSLQVPIDNSLLWKMGFNRKMKRAICYGPRHLGRA